jgi:hypothetical protein
LYLVENDNADVGLRVAVNVAADQLTFEEMRVFPRRSWIVDVLIVEGSIASLNRTETVGLADTPDAPFEGEME